MYREFLWEILLIYGNLKDRVHGRITLRCILEKWECEERKGIELAQHRVLCWALVLSVLKLRVVLPDNLNDYQEGLFSCNVLDVCPGANRF